VKAVFADTFYWAALTKIDDPAHAKAMDLSQSLAPDMIVTTDEVLSEYLTFFAGAGPGIRSHAGRIVGELIENLAVRVVPQSRGSFLKGLELYRERPDKGYSLTDCISMQTMRRDGLTEVLTNDRHFEQEGFRALFRDS
jgi:predicted nucleic acid-binding protein